MIECVKCTCKLIDDSILVCKHNGIDLLWLANPITIYSTVTLQKGKQMFKILWTESLNRDGHQFHQYQLNGQSPLILSHWTLIKTTKYNVGNPGPNLGQA